MVMDVRWNIVLRHQSDYPSPTPFPFRPSHLFDARRNLGDNKLTYLPEGIFKGLASLEEL